jgi:hypothetical protein
LQQALARAEALRTAHSAAAPSSQAAPKDAELAKAVATLRARAEAADRQAQQHAAKLPALVAASAQAALELDGLLAKARTAATQSDEQSRQLAPLEQRRLEAWHTLAARKADLVAAERRQADAEAYLAAAQQPASHEVDQSRALLGERWAAALLAAPLKPLGPEQLGWSTLAVTGVFEAHRKQAERELAKGQPTPAMLAAAGRRRSTPTAASIRPCSCPTTARCKAGWRQAPTA